MAGKNVYSNEGERDDKDRERVASMANEGGASAAHMDTREQLESAGRGRLKKRRRIPWMWGAAAAGAAVTGAALARTIAGARKLAGTRKKARGATAIEIETEPRRGRAKRRRSAKTQRTGAKRGSIVASSPRKGAKTARRTAVTLQVAERASGSPKRRRGGNNSRVRKTGKTARGRQAAAAR